MQRRDSQQPDPIDNMPRRGNIVTSAILVIEVVPMPPNVQPEDGRMGERHEHSGSCSGIDLGTETSKRGILRQNLLR